ncbi:helix-turn-helix domain-containing protein [Xenorhabdus vietnamensis]|nr:helix-turn-helix domain-containing protein [Xenorhabdus vietnamensis]
MRGTTLAEVSREAGLSSSTSRYFERNGQLIERTVRKRLAS